MPEKIDRVNVPASTGAPTHAPTHAPPGAPGRGTPGPAACAAVLVYTTFPSLSEAERIGAALVDMHLAACVNLLPGMRSLYRWQSRVEQGEEVVGIIKTEARLVARVTGAVCILHAYTNPAVVAIPVVAGAPRFLDWIGEETRAAGGSA